MGDKPTCLYAWVADDENGKEYLIAGKVPLLGLIPLVGHDEAAVRRLSEYAMARARKKNRVARLVRYEGAQVLETLEPWNTGGRDRAEHIVWARERALVHVEAGDCVEAVASMLEDLLEHPETERLVLGPFGALLFSSGGDAARAGADRTRAWLGLVG